MYARDAATNAATEAATEAAKEALKEATDLIESAADSVAEVSTDVDLSGHRRAREPRHGTGKSAFSARSGKIINGKIADFRCEPCMYIRTVCCI